MSGPTPAATAATVAAFAETLLPGDDLFPSATQAGAHGLLLDRLRWRLGQDGIDRLAAGLGDGFAGLAPEGRVAAVRRLEAADPALFHEARSILTFAYYASLLVVRAIRSLGHVYNDAPQPLGYALPAFRAVPGETVPTTPRGWYKRTEDVSRVALPADGAAR